MLHASGSPALSPCARTDPLRAGASTACSTSPAFQGERLAVLQYKKIALRKPGLAPLVRQALRRLVQALVGQAVEGAPVDGERLARVHVLVHLDRLGGVEVHDLHEPARLVGADRDRSKVKAAEAPADLGEILRIAGIPEIGRAHV